jgi:hypothetical protein
LSNTQPLSSINRHFPLCEKISLIQVAVPSRIEKHAAFTRDLNGFPLSPDYVADVRQDYLAAWDKLSLNGDIEISDKSIA